MQSTRFYSVEDLSHMPRPQWLIEGLFEANSLVMLAAPSYSFKSFMAIDWMMCMATGKDWNHRQVVETKPLYVLGEGRGNLIKRIQGWIKHHHPTKEELRKIHENFRVTFDVPQMAMKSSVDNLLASLNEDGYHPSVIVLDTFARAAVGLDENSQKDTGIWIDACERLRGLGMTVIFLHHTAKNTEFGVKYRGSTAIMGAMDTAMTMQRDFKNDQVELRIDKQKDHDEGKPMVFRKLLVPLPGETEGSMVLVPTSAQDERFTEDYKKVEDFMMGLLAENYESDRSRARVMAATFNMTESGAQTRLRRFRKDHGLPQEPLITLTDDEILHA